jgi:heterodisulfide reductase subunit A
LAQRAQAHGQVSLIQVPAVDQLRVEAGGEQVVLQWHDAAGAAQEQEMDMVVLLTGVVPRQDSAALFELLGLTATEAGFAAPDHNFLRALQSNVEGVYVAGGVTGPRRVVESVAQGQGAVGLALARLTPGRKLAVESVTARVDETACSGCLTCVAVCPYQANQKDPDNGRVQTNEVLCKGCGVCVASCPSGAAAARHFSDSQLQAEIAEVLRDA